MAEQKSNSIAGCSKKNMDVVNIGLGATGKRSFPAAHNAKYERLPSIRHPRDLTLSGLSIGGAPKRTFAPNIPVRREKSEDSNTLPGKGKPKIADSPQNRRKHSKSDGQGRGRNRPEYIQTDGIFSEGIGGATKKPSSSHSSRSSYGQPKPFVHAKPKIKKEPNEEKDDKDVLDSLLRDDFIDDGSDDDEDVLNPVFVPMEDNIGGKIKTEYGLPKNVPFIKKEKEDIKPNIGEMPMEVCDKKPNVAIKSEPLEPCELFAADDITEDKQLLFFQFPDVLGVTQQQPEENNRSQGKNFQDPSQDTLPQNSGVKLSDFPEGYIGKLQILKSGKTRLVLGSLVLDVEMGSPISTLHDLVSIRTGISGGDMTVLGHIHHKLVCMPDIETLLTQCLS